MPHDELKKGSTELLILALLEGRPRSDAGATAPAHGLYLEGVAYP